MGGDFRLDALPPEKAELFADTLLRVTVDDDRRATFSIARVPLLELTFARDRSASDRQLFYVTGGVLARPTRRGRLEFRVTPDGAHLLTAIHEFEPRLPWPLYRATQALVHAWVMARFGEHLAGQPAVPARTPAPALRLVPA